MKRMSPWSIPVNGASNTKACTLQIIDIPTEQTTAATDALLAIFAVGAIVYLSRFTAEAPFKVRIWCGMFACIATAASLGTIVHGLVMSSAVKHYLWQPLALALALSVGTLALGAVHDTWGLAAVRRTIPFMLVVIVVLYAAAKFTAIGMMLNIFFVGGVLFFALGAYILQVFRGQMGGAGYMSAGLLLTVCAGIIQVRRSMSCKFIWEFDHNGIFHLVQLLALFLLVVGLRRSFA